MKDFSPNFSEKIDAVPGITTTLRVTATRTGSYPVECTELCGAGHSLMRSAVRVVSPTAFASWLRSQPANGPPPVGTIPPNWRPYLDKLPSDPWGHPYQYANPGLNGEIDVYSFGACVEGLEVIGYRGELYHADTGSVVILEPGEPHTGGPAEPPSFVYRAMYPGGDLLAELSGYSGTPRFREPVIADPLLAAELIRAHAELSRGADPLEAETRLSWLFGELVRRHATPQLSGLQVRRGRVAKVVMAQLADQLACPPGLA